MTAWRGGFVRDRVGIEVRSDPDRSLVAVERLVGLALRDNPKRAQLLVSTVLAKHVPTRPVIAVAAGRLLGRLVEAALRGHAPDPAPFRALEQVLGGDDDARVDVLRDALDHARVDASPSSVGVDVLTIGYAETATGLGHLVAGEIGSRYLHSSRHAPVQGLPSIAFEEEHSHASSHLLSPTDETWLRPGGTIVLVDDEISTGTTIINTIRAMHAHEPQARWVAASLIDLRSDADRARFEALAAELGTRIDVVALGNGRVDLPDGVHDTARAVVAEHRRPAVAADAAAGSSGLGDVIRVDVETAPVRSARFGVPGEIDAGLVGAIADGIREALPTEPGGGVLVVGSEEFIAVPMLVAERLDEVVGGVRFSTSTRSPIAPIDRPDYAIATAVTFRSHDDTVDGPGPRFAYNLTRGGRRFGAVVLLPEPGAPADRVFADGGVVEALRRVTDHVLVVDLPVDLPATGERIRST